MNYTINTIEQLKPILIGFRKSRGLTQHALAERLNISQQSYQALESAPQKATLERLYKVLGLLNVKLHFTDNAKNHEHLPTTKNQGSQQDDW